jgi:type II secretory ATPase GspE/PulE/Tfp pilus assembly ATPase PilB-like protein
MPRRFVLLFAALVLLLGADAAMAQATSTAWPPNLDRLLNLQDPAKFVRGPGGYIGIIRLALCWLVFAGWIRSTDWINQDAIKTKGSYRQWNQIATFGFVVAVLLVWMMNTSIVVSLPLLLIGWAAPVGAYVWKRNARPEVEEKAFTPEHLRVVLAPLLARVGVKIAIEAKPRGRNAPPPIDYKPQGGANEIANNANLLKAKQLPGFFPCGLLLLDALDKRANSVMLDFTREATAVRYLIDTVWVDAGSRDRPTGDGILAVLKTVAALNPEDRTNKQRGTFGIQKEKTKFQCRIMSAGTKTGERAIVQIDDGKARKAKVADIGMPQDLQDKLKEAVGQKRGFVLVSAPPAGGMTTLMAATVGGLDRFMRSALAMEDETNKDLEVENVPIKTYGPASGLDIHTTLTELVRQYPDVIVVPELNDPQVVGVLCEQATIEERLVIAGIRAKEAAEAPLRVLMLKVSIKQFIPALTAVVNERLVRKLCETCKEEYPATPQMVQQLRLPADVTTFSRPPQEKPGEKKPKDCPDCGSTRYKGVTGIFELLIIDDKVRAAFMNKPTLETVRQAAQKSGMRTLQEQGIALVAKGVTSLAELKRVLTEKQEA